MIAAYSTKWFQGNICANVQVAENCPAYQELLRNVLKDCELRVFSFVEGIKATEGAMYCVLCYVAWSYLQVKNTLGSVLVNS